MNILYLILLQQPLTRILHIMTSAKVVSVLLLITEVLFLILSYYFLSEWYSSVLQV